jgi:PPK2 family polyphosphate:nucleotide phosphotransferase
VKIDCAIENYRVSAGLPINLAGWPTDIPPLYSSQKNYKELLDESRARLSELQNILFACNRYSVLLIFQGMDTAGKGGAIKHVMSGVNPQGCQVFCFQQPNNEELDHDFLWRACKRLPERGRIGIFDRSYYEDVLVPRVFQHVLKQQRVPEEFVDPARLWEERYRDIVNLEDYLHRNGTRIVKIFLHLSKAEQRRRFLARIDEPRKNWKLTAADLEVRGHWNDFQAAYAACIGKTGTAFAPWHIVPADDKRNARLIVSKIVVETMEALSLSYPEPNAARLEELRAIRRRLELEGD